MIRIDKIVEHYNHAKAKHPYFADYIALMDNSPDGAKIELQISRDHLTEAVEHGTVGALDHVLRCEMDEIALAVAQKDNAQAVEECYDAIAVLLRIVDVIEGRQKLGFDETNMTISGDSAE